MIQSSNSIDGNVLTHYPGQSQDLRKRGVWFIDSYGRYVLFRGVNIGSQSKRGPLYLPLKINSYSNVDSELKKITPCLDSLKELGFNVVRLLVMWKALQPAPDVQINHDYLHALNKIITALNQRDIFVIIDFHQDLAHEAYGGDGFPDWATLDDERITREQAEADHARCMAEDDFHHASKD